MSKDEVFAAMSNAVVQALKEERARRNLSLNELAQRAGLSQSFLSRLEKNERQPTLNTFFRLCSALEVDAATVLASIKLTGRSK